MIPIVYNLNIRCYVVIELKTGDFKPGIRQTFYLYREFVKKSNNPVVLHKIMWF